MGRFSLHGKIGHNLNFDWFDNSSQVHGAVPFGCLCEIELCCCYCVLSLMMLSVVVTLSS